MEREGHYFYLLIATFLFPFFSLSISKAEGKEKPPNAFTLQRDADEGTRAPVFGSLGQRERN